MATNNFYLDSTTRMFHSFMSEQAALGRRSSKTVSGEAKDSISVFQQQIAAAKSRQESLLPENMTLEEYKQYIYRKISALPVHPSNQYDSVSVQISDEGFQAMQKDPEYEKWVLDTLRRNFAFYNPWSGICGGNYVMHRFGASKEEYRGNSFAKGVDGGRKESILEGDEETFWERRARRNKEYLEALEEMDIENHRMRRVFREAAIRKGDYDGMFDNDNFSQMLNLADFLLMQEPGNTKS